MEDNLFSTLASARRVSCLHILSLDPDSQQSVPSGSLRFGRHVGRCYNFYKPMTFCCQESKVGIKLSSGCWISTLFYRKPQEPDIHCVLTTNFCSIWSAHSLGRTIAVLFYCLSLAREKINPSHILFCRWIKSAVREAYTSACNSQFVWGLVGISANKSRALAAFWVAFNSVSVEEILKSAHWNNYKTTFTKFYLHDMSDFSEQIPHLGPL